jgi:DnaD/phage-associated family protein
MPGFSGFPDGKIRTTPLPEQFFTDLLPQVDHLGELKATLYAFWRLSVKEGRYRYLRRQDFTDDETFMRGLAPAARQSEEVLDDALERAEARGTLLHVMIEDAHTVQNLYFMNSPKGREAVDKLTHGEWRPDETAGTVVTLSQMRSGVFVVYEQNIGPLTPMVAEELRDMEATYPVAWIEDAVRIAVKNNARKLKYILAVLERMRTEGRHEQEDRDVTEHDAYLRRYDGYRPFLDDDAE